jgi:hypothetical protein
VLLEDIIDVDPVFNIALHLFLTCDANLIHQVSVAAFFAPVFPVNYNFKSGGIVFIFLNFAGIY